MEPGPVEYAVIAFPGSEFSGRIAPALADLTDRGVIRLIDLTFVQKQDDGTVVTLELDALPKTHVAAYDALDGEVSGLLSEQDVAELAEQVPPGSSAALLVWEDRWAQPLAAAVRESGGELVDRQTIPYRIVANAMRAREESSA